MTFLHRVSWRRDLIVPIDSNPCAAVGATRNPRMRGHALPRSLCPQALEGKLGKPVPRPDNVRPERKLPPAVALAGFPGLY